jgi:hypothetical protein
MLMNVIVHRVKMTEYVKTRRDLLNVIVKMVLPGSYVRMALIVVHQILVLMGYVRILWEVLSVNARIGTVNLVGRLSPKLNVNLTWLFIISKAKNSVESIFSAGLYSRSALEFIVTSVMSNVLSFVDDDKELNFIYEPTLNPTELYWHLSPQ